MTNIAVIKSRMASMAKKLGYKVTYVVRQDNSVDGIIDDGWDGQIVGIIVGRNGTWGTEEAMAQALLITVKMINDPYNNDWLNAVKLTGQTAIGIKLDKAFYFAVQDFPLSYEGGISDTSEYDRYMKEYVEALNRRYGRQPGFYENILPIQVKKVLGY